MTHIVPRTFLLLVGSAAMLALSSSAQAQAPAPTGAPCMVEWRALSAEYEDYNKLQTIYLRESGRLWEQIADAELELQTLEALAPPQAEPLSNILKSRLAKAKADYENFNRGFGDRLARSPRVGTAELRYSRCMERTAGHWPYRKGGTGNLLPPDTPRDDLTQIDWGADGPPEELLRPATPPAPTRITTTPPTAPVPSDTTSPAPGTSVAATDPGSPASDQPGSAS